jgi:hypothetical protein
MGNALGDLPMGASFFVLINVRTQKKKKKRMDVGQ